MNVEILLKAGFVETFYPEDETESSDQCPENTRWIGVEG